MVNVDVVDVQSLIETELNEIWQKSQYKDHSDDQIREVIQRGFVAHSPIPSNALVFVGINPSFGNDQVSVVSESEGKWGVFQALEQKDNPYQRYFSKFETIAKEVNEAWTHIDMLYFRETKQGFVENLLKDKSGRQFIEEQLDLTKKIIEAISPKILVVSNTAARNFLIVKNEDVKEYFGYKFVFDNNFGTHILELASNDGKTKKIPTFFTSMLTGQRALDNGSFQRLQWHIKFALDKL